MSLKIELLEQSFEQVKPYSEEFAESFYSTLFEEYPDIASLFVHTSMPKQRKMLFGALTLVTENLRNPDVLETALKGLGTRHVQYGALPEYYPLFGAILLKTLESFLAETWTSEVKQAWIEAYASLTKLMLEGSEYSEDVVKLNPS